MKLFLNMEIDIIKGLDLLKILIKKKIYLNKI